MACVSFAQEVALCMGPGVVRAFCGRLARDYRHSCGGLPDLTLWNPAEHRCMLVEVCMLVTGAQM
jgi:hypothetical protein